MAALNMKVPFNMVTTNDIVGGNSGSPVVNRKGEIVGLIFDGNIQSLPGYFVYQEEINRAVAVDSRGILEALRSIYKADRIAEEIGGKAPAKK
jgi:V8-like Glu-specific endopeptidase